METVDIVGIDLGTTKSVIAVWSPETQESVIVPNREGELITPSAVALGESSGELLVGRAAIARMLTDPGQVAYSVKRFIGRPFSDKWVQYDKRNVTYAIEEAAQQKVQIRLGDRLLSPPEVSAAVLRKLKNDAEEALGRKIAKAVITVPAYFNEAQRWATKEAGELAGLYVPRIVNEPTASALAFGLGAETQTVAVYDLGGGTFDISILRIDRGLFRVRAVGGDTHLGGDDFDMAIASWLNEQFEAQHARRLPVEDDPVLRARLREAAKTAKVSLTTKSEAVISLPTLLPGDGAPLGLEATLTRRCFEELIAPFIDRSLAKVDEALSSARMEATAIDQVLLVGGQTRTPAVKEALGRRYGWKINDSLPPEQAVARGAAVLGARLSGYLKDRIKLWDVIPLSLGVELAGGFMEWIIKANEEIPVTRKWPRVFTTQRDGQEQIRFRVFQGTRPLAIDNVLIGEVKVNLSPPRPRGEQQIICTFTVDHDGILHVRAEDRNSDSQPQEETFDHVYRMSPEEVDKRLKEAAEHHEEDELTVRIFALRDELAEVRSQATGSDLTSERQAERAARLLEVEAALDARDAERAQALLNALRT